MTEGAGGHAMVLRKGDATSGDILLQIIENGQETALFERVVGSDGRYRFAPCGPNKSPESNDFLEYIARRTRFDADLWIIELAIPEAERFVDSLTI